MSQSLSRRSFLKYAGSGAVSLAAALLTGVSGAALAPCYEGEPALLDGKAAVELLGYAPAPELDSTLVYLSVENLSARPLAVGASYLQSRGLDSRNALYSLGTGSAGRSPPPTSSIPWAWASLPGATASLSAAAALQRPSTVRMRQMPLPLP